MQCKLANTKIYEIDRIDKTDEIDKIDKIAKIACRGQPRRAPALQLTWTPGTIHYIIMIVSYTISYYTQILYTVHKFVKMNFHDPVGIRIPNI